MLMACKMHEHITGDYNWVQVGLGLAKLYLVDLQILHVRILGFSSHSCGNANGLIKSLRWSLCLFSGRTHRHPMLSE